MKKMSTKTKVRYIIKTLFRPFGTKFEINLGYGFITVNRFQYLYFTLNELKNICK